MPAAIRNHPDLIIKRDGRAVPFDPEKIASALTRAYASLGIDRPDIVAIVTSAVSGTLKDRGETPTVERVQNMVERGLLDLREFEVAKAYILYRAEHARIREEKDSHVQAEDNIPYKILWRVFTWSVDHHCDTIEKLNRTSGRCRNCR